MATLENLEKIQKLESLSQASGLKKSKTVPRVRRNKITRKLPGRFIRRRQPASA